MKPQKWTLFQKDLAWSKPKTLPEETSVMRDDRSQSPFIFEHNLARHGSHFLLEVELIHTR